MTTFEKVEEIRGVSHGATSTIKHLYRIHDNEAPEYISVWIRHGDSYSHCLMASDANHADLSAAQFCRYHPQGTSTSHPDSLLTDYIRAERHPVNPAPTAAADWVRQAPHIPDMPPQWQEQAIQALVLTHEPIPCSSLASAIMRISWTISPQGSDYWSKVYTKINTHQINHPEQFPQT